MNAPNVQDRGLGPLAVPAYTVAAIMLLLPLLDAAFAIRSFSPTMYRWRFGAMGILSSNIVTPLFGMLVILVVAWLERQRWVVRTLTWVTLVLGVVLAGMIVMFVLDGLQMRAEMPADAQGNFLNIAGKALIAQFLALFGLGTLSLAGWRAARRMRPGDRAGRKDPEGLVMASVPR